MKQYIVYGIGISGTSTAKYLNDNNYDVVATDDNELSLKENALKFPKIKFLKPSEINFDENSLISFSPGIPLYFPKPHKILEIVKKTNAELLCDIEIFFRFNSYNKFIAITGTNGKSTTTALVGFIFEQLQIPSAIGGNIGVPCFELPQNQHNFSYIFETSSFQLDLISRTHFQISALLNITSDHIDRHGSLENYIAAKKRIFMNSAEGDYAIINVDNKNSLKVFDELKNDKNFKANLIGISTQKIIENGISLIDGNLHLNIGKDSLKHQLKSEFLRGKHNDENMAFAFAITYCHFLQESKKGLPFPVNLEQKIIESIKKFKGLRHRLQIVGRINNINFVNDSKATNAESTENALKSYDNIFWILGGRSKEGGISILKPYFKKIVKAYLIGEASEDFAKVLKENSVNFEICGDLKNAFQRAFEDAKANKYTKNLDNNIILSPACASFDQWKNFEQRGDFFCELVKKISG